MNEVKETLYQRNRYIFFGIVTFILFIIPWIKIDNRHLALLSFDKKQFHLFFTIFDMQELYLIPFLLILLFLGVFFLTTLGGRIWCSWACPQTIFRVIYRDFIQTTLLKLYRNTSNKQTKTKDGAYFSKTLGIVIWTLLSLVAASNFMWYFIPPEDFFSYIQSPDEHKVLFAFLAGITAFLVFDVVLMKENFCIYVCPYARIQSVMYDEDTVQVIYDEKRGGTIYDKQGNKIGARPQGENDECIGCEACVKVCPTHIDIRKGMQLECINCLACVDECSKIMAKLSKPSLVVWSSPNAVEKRAKVKLLRFRTIGYCVVLAIVFSALLIMSSKKEYMLLNINRTTQLYDISNDGKKVENAYTFLFQNTDSKDHRYYFEVSHPDITIKMPDKSFLLKAGKKAKKIVILETSKVLSTNDRDATPIDIVITAYSTDDKERINVKRHTVFFYPKYSDAPKQ